MKTTLRLTAGAALMLAGCAGHGNEPTATTGEQYIKTATTNAEHPGGGASGTGTSPEPVLLPDGVFLALDHCAVQMGETCSGGYLVHELNGAHGVHLVSGFDVSQLDPNAVAQANGGGDALVFRGRFGPAEGHDRPRGFLVVEVWRRLPRPEPRADEPVFALDVVDGARYAFLLDAPSAAIVDEVTVERAASRLVDSTWLASRVLEHGALVSGVIEGAKLTARHVYVRLPDVAGPCNTRPVHCRDGEAETYERDTDRCLVARGCVPAGDCPGTRPVCDAGYVLTSWPSRPAACPAFACEPAFLTP